MTKIGVISDSHGALANVRAASEALKECSYILHLGDHERDADEIGEKNGVHVIALAGNCDLFSQAPTEAVFEVERVRVLGVHGHREGVKNGLLHLSLKAEQAGARLVLFGHTHIPGILTESGIIFVNPGALRDGRYAVVEIDGERVNAELKRL